MNLKDLKEDEPKDGLQTFIRNNYPDKSEYQFADTSDIGFSKLANQQLRRLLMFHPLWKPNKIPSGKNVSDMCRAIKIQRVHARAHRNAYHSMKRHKLVLSG